MGYFQTTSPEAAPPVISCATPKTHVPGSPVKQRGHRYYSTMMSRWVSRDPIKESGGVNLYFSLKNSPVDIVDKLGMWGTSVHYGKTRDWASFQFFITYALDIANADEAVDSGASGPLPWQQQDRHLKYTKDGQDSRSWWYKYEYDMALEYLHKADRLGDVSYCSEAASSFGRGLHSGQDISAHRPWPGGGDWWGVVAHPSWWDDWYGELESGYTAYDYYWWRFWDFIYLNPVYDAWYGSSVQVASQDNARRAVTVFSIDAITSFADDVRKSCVCKRAMLNFTHGRHIL